jgi:hypothetical protein
MHGTFRTLVTNLATTPGYFHLSHPGSRQLFVGAVNSAAEMELRDFAIPAHRFAYEIAKGAASNSPHRTLRGLMWFLDH